jgi:hypothetical protein
MISSHSDSETHLWLTVSLKRPFLQKHPSTHWSVQACGSGLSQVKGQAEPHRLYSSPS